MNRRLRRLLKMETPEQRETRERVEFIRSLPKGEQIRLKEFFAKMFGSAAPDSDTIQLTPAQTGAVFQAIRNAR